MPVMRMRVTGAEHQARAIGNLLSSIDGIEHVEEVADLMPRLDDEDSTSAGLPDDQGPGTHELEVEARSQAAVGRVREAVEALAFDLDVLVEFESDEDWHDA